MVCSMICYKCKIDKDKTVKSFGKDICLPCLKKRKTGKKGHSGMVYDKKLKGNQTNFTTGLQLIKVK